MGGHQNIRGDLPRLAVPQSRKREELESALPRAQPALLPRKRKGRSSRLLTTRVTSGASAVLVPLHPPNVLPDGYELHPQVEAEAREVDAVTEVTLTSETRFSPPLCRRCPSLPAGWRALLLFRRAGAADPLLEMLIDLAWGWAQ